MKYGLAGVLFAIYLLGLAVGAWTTNRVLSKAEEPTEQVVVEEVIEKIYIDKAGVDCWFGVAPNMTYDAEEQHVSLTAYCDPEILYHYFPAVKP